MPLVRTAYDPDTSQGWYLAAEKVYAQGPPGTRVVSEYVDARILSIAGIDLWGGLGIDNVHDEMSRNGLWIYYMSLWRNPPNPILGFDDYRCIAVHRP